MRTRGTEADGHSNTRPQGMSRLQLGVIAGLVVLTLVARAESASAATTADIRGTTAAADASPDSHPPRLEIAFG